MRILQVITSLSTGGAEKLVADAVPLWQEKGIHVDVLTLKDVETPFKKLLLEKSKGEVMGLTVGSVYHPILIFKLMPYLKQYDLLHVHLFPTLYWVVLAKWLSFSKVKIVYTEHSTHNRRRNSWWGKYIDRIIYRGVTQIVSISEEVEVNIKRHLQWDTSNFRSIPNGVNLQDFKNAFSHDKMKWGKTSDRFLIQVSSYRYPKDQPTLIRALTYLPNHFKLLLVGNGPLLKKCKELVEELLLLDRVHFLGIRMDIPQLLKTADYIVLSSYHEGLSLSSIEGMTVGKPFIASDVPGLREIIGGAGILFPVGEAHTLAEEILKLENDTDYYQQVANQCMQRSAQFDIHTMVNQYYTLYQEII